MSERTIDTPPMNLADALAYRELHRWRKIRPASLQAVDALADEVDRLHTECEQALGYLQNLFRELAPQCESLGTLMGLCTQIDNYITGAPAAPPQIVEPRDDYPGKEDGA